MSHTTLSERACEKAILRWKLRFDEETVIWLAILVMYSLLVAAACFGLLQVLTNRHDNIAVHSQSRSCACPNIFEYSGQGSWVKSDGESSAVPTNQKHVPTDLEIRRALRMPDELHRDDLRCGFMFPISNTTIPSACNASSEHACCSEHTGWCGSTKYHCENPKSSDFSKLVPSNVAVWQQSSNKCKLEEISREAACDLLNSNQFILIFIGDSEARKMLTALLLFLSEDFSNVLHTDIDAPKRRMCQDEMQLLNSDCRQYTRKSSIFFSDDELCGNQNSFLAEYFPDFNTFLTSATRKRIETLYDIENTYIILNSGYHFNANPMSFIQYYLRHIVGMLRGKQWPRLIVETLPKTPSVVLSDQRWAFRSDVNKFCKENGITVFDNFPLSDRLMPYDGKHFRLPFYLQKIKILMNFLTVQTNPC